MGKHAAECNYKAPMSIGTNGQPFRVKSTDPTYWLNFDEAASFASYHNLDIGYMLTADDPFCCIDFDVKDYTNEPDESKWTNQDAYTWFWDVVQRWASYTEISTSGKGLHMWVRANIGQGARRHPFEVYSQERFIICTGNAVLDAPILERQEFVVDFTARLRAGSDDENEKLDLIEVPAVFEDSKIWDMAANADNSYNFLELCEGRWQQFNHPSHSEADLSLMSMFAFYSKSNEQCRRLFKQTKLCRDKHIKSDRLINKMLQTIRTRQANENKIEINSTLLAMREQRARENPVLYLPEYATTHVETPPTPFTVTLAAPLPATAAAITEGISWPPGFIGHLACFIYESSPRPVKEVSIVAALGLMAGLCGKHYHFNGSGLNIYLVLIARSGVGKEAMHSGISAVLKAVSKKLITVYQFVNFSDFASGQALTKGCASNPSFVNVTGEWGRKLKRLSKEDGSDPAMGTLRTTMTNLYQKSGPQAIVGGITYSNKDSNIEAVSGVAYSMIGETTPKTFYESLTESMMEDGFLSRFTVIEYTGERVPLNQDIRTEPPDYITEAILFIAQEVTRNIGNSASKGVCVTADLEAATLLKAFDQECDKQINDSQEDESWRQMWNRASLKVMRIASLLAVGDNPITPCITLVHAEWAIGLIRRDIEIMQKKIESGEVGLDDNARNRKLIDILREYCSPQPLGSGYKVNQVMKDNQIIPHQYLVQRTSQLNLFNKHKLGSNEALRQTIRNLCDSNVLLEVQKDKLSSLYNYFGRGYRILSLPDSHFRKNGK